MPFSRILPPTSSSILLFLCLFLTLNVSYASKTEDMSHYQDNLEKLQKSIAKVQQHLKGSKKKRSAVVTELKTLDQEISKSANKLKHLEASIQNTRTQANKLKQDLKLLNEQLNNQRAILSEQIRSAYSMGHQQNLKMLLNQQDPAQTGRAQIYFNYLNLASQQEIQSFMANLELKQQTEVSLQQNLAAQNALLQTQREKKRERQKQRFQRKKLLAELSKKSKIRKPR